MLIKNYLDQEVEIDEKANIIKPLNHVYDNEGNRYRIICIRYNHCNQNCTSCKVSSNVLYIQTEQQEYNDGQEYNIK